MKTKLLSLLIAISFMVGLLPVAIASAETTATSAPTPATTAPTTPDPNSISLSVKLCENSSTLNYAVTLTATKGGKAVYATTNDSGTPFLVTGDSVPKNKYVKFEYPQNGLPTITLMNARLRSTGNVLDLSSFDAPVKIVIAGDSTIESTTNNGIYRTSYGDIIISGPKKLTMNCYNSAINFSGAAYTNSLTLKDLKLKATAYANTTGHTIQIPAGNLTVDNSNIELNNRAGLCVYLGQGSVIGLGSATFSNSVFSATSQNTAFRLDGNLAITNSNVQFSSDKQALTCGSNLSLYKSTLFMTGNSNAKETVDVAGNFTLRMSNAEIIGTKFAIFSETTLPRTLGEYTVLAGISKETTTAFIDELASAYQYYYAESLEQPTEPTEPTVSETVPTETAPSETAPICTDPTCTDPTCTEPTYSAPMCTDPTCTDPTCTEFTEFTEATLPPPTETEATEPTNTLATLPTPTPPTSSTVKKSAVTFWILTALMVLGAGGAATMAVIMFRRAAEEDEEDERDEENIPQEIPENTDAEESEEDVDEKPKKFSLMGFKKFFTKDRKEDILEEELPAEIEETLCEEALEKVTEEPLEEVVEEPQIDMDEQLEAIIKEFHEDPVEEPAEESEEGTEERPKKFSMDKLKAFLVKILEETTEDDTDEDPEN